jgi:hypothetical protein
MRERRDVRAKYLLAEDALARRHTEEKRRLRNGFCFAIKMPACSPSPGMGARFATASHGPLLTL